MGKQWFKIDAQAYFAEILGMKSLILWPKISNSQINQFSKDCSEKGIGKLGKVPNYIIPSQTCKIEDDVSNTNAEGKHYWYIHNIP